VPRSGPRVISERLPTRWRTRAHSVASGCFKRLCRLPIVDNDTCCLKKRFLLPTKGRPNKRLQPAAVDAIMIRRG